MVELIYRGRKISQQDILYIRGLIEQHPQESRRMLSTRLCEAWQWRQANGALRDMVCRGLLLMLDRAGRIKLPPVSYVRHNPLAHRASTPNSVEQNPAAVKKWIEQPAEKSPIDPSTIGLDDGAQQVHRRARVTQTLNRLHRI